MYTADGLSKREDNASLGRLLFQFAYIKGSDFSCRICLPVIEVHKMNVLLMLGDDINLHFYVPGSVFPFIS